MESKQFPHLWSVYYWWYFSAGNLRWAACPFPLRQSPHDISLQEICISVYPEGAHDRCVNKKKKYAGSESHSPHQLRKRSHFGTKHRKAPPPRKERKNKWVSRGLQAWPETGSWWELITALERARLVRTSLAAKFTECTWSLEASFFTLWESRSSSLKGFRVWVL